MRVGLERRAQRLSHRLEEEKRAVENETSASLEAIREVKMQVRRDKE